MLDLFSYYDNEQLGLIDYDESRQTKEAEITQDTILNETLSDKKGHRTLVLYGDSMIDTMETNAPYLQNALQKIYPNISFDLLNYGIGAQPASKGLERINTSFEYKDRSYLPALEAKADIYIVDSFAYNPMENLAEYESALRGILEQFKSNGKPVYLVATIAPLKSNFGKGPGGVNWESDIAWTHATKIQTHIEKAIAVASYLNIPVIDCYHQTLQSNGEGIASMVNSHDGIHPSVAGHQFIAKQVADFIEI